MFRLYKFQFCCLFELKSFIGIIIMHFFPLIHIQAKSIILYFYLDHPILNCLVYVRQVEYLKGELLIKDALDTLAKHTRNL